MSAVGWALVGTLPWVLLGVFLVVRLREPRGLPGSGGPGAARDWPSVSIIVPARNEARSIERCVRSLASQEYPDFEVVVVDDRSEDGTGALARGVDLGSARAIRVIEGEPLPAGWFGKPWACHTGSRSARGELLLFTDADTTHDPDLLRRAVAGLQEDRAGALSLVGRQEMETFWERLVLPQFFFLIGMRFPRLDRPIEPNRWQDAIANGQYILVSRGAYDAIGGHGAVKGEVVEDLRLAQELTKGGHRLTVRGAEDAFSTRMYTSLPELVNGWTKNLAVGAQQSAGRLGPIAIPGMLAFSVGIWLAPPVALGVALVTGSTPLLLWSGITTAFAITMWAGAYARFGASLAYGSIYFMGVAVSVFIALRSLLRGRRRIEWKGRRYDVRGTPGEEVTADR